MANEGITRLGAPLNIRTNAFMQAPKLKKDVMAHKQGKAASNKPHGNQRITAADETENRPDIAGAADSSPPADTASPAHDASRAAAIPAVRLTTAKKGKRIKTRTGGRNSEVTVYYDAVQSPDDDGTKTIQQKTRGTRGAAAQAAAAAAAHAAADQTDQLAPAPNPQGNAAASSEHDAATAAFIDELSAAQPEAMDAEYSDDIPAVKAAEETCLAAAATTAAARGSKGSQAVKGKLHWAGDVRPAAAAAPSSRHVSSDAHHQDDEEQREQHAGISTEATAREQSNKLRDGQEIFKYMQQLAEDAEQLLPQEQEQKKRSRGRAKKDLRLVDALHQSWKGKSYYERLQEITRQEVAEEEEKMTAAAAPELRPPLSLLPDQSTMLQVIVVSKGVSSQQEQQGDHDQDNGSQGARKRRTQRQSIRPALCNAVDDSGSNPTAAEVVTGAASARPAGLPSKRRATGTVAGSVSGSAAAAIAGTSTRKTLTTSAAVAAAVGKSPAPGLTAIAGRPGSSKVNNSSSLAWDSTPAAPSSILADRVSDRPPWSVGGAAATAAAGGGAAATGGAAAAATAKSDRGVLQKLQAAYDAKLEELAAVKDQLKECQGVAAKLKQEQKAHPKALQQQEKQRLVLEKKLEASERKQVALERDNEALHEKLARQEGEKAALQEQLSKSDKEVKLLRSKLKQVNAKLDKFNALGSKLQEMGTTLAAEAQPVPMD